MRPSLQTRPSNYGMIVREDDGYRNVPSKEFGILKDFNKRNVKR